MRRLLTIVIVLAVVAGGSYLIYSQLQPASESTLPEDVRTASVTRGPITASISATGSLSPERLSPLAFTGSGRVVEVLVEEGDTVETDQVLARLGTADLELAVRQAEAALAASEATLARTIKPPSEEEINAARVAVAAAGAQLADARSGPSQLDQDLAKLQVDQAKNSLWGAQGSRDATAGNPMAGGGAVTTAEAQVLNAEVGVRIAELQQQKLLEPPSQAAVAGAQNQLATAEANLARLLSTPSQEDIAVAEAQVAQARVSLEIARERLDDVLLKAPFDGVIASWNLYEGDVVGPTSQVGSIGNLDQYHITLNIDETEISTIREGQRALITLDALPDEELEGVVSRIDLVGSSVQNLIMYGVRIDIEPTELPVKPLMTASLQIVVDEKDDVLLVPIRAIRTDDLGAYVERVQNGTLARVDVTLGLSDNMNIEIVDGDLRPGQEVVISQPRSGIFGAFGG